MSRRHIWAVISLEKLFLLCRKHLVLSPSSDKPDESETLRHFFITPPRWRSHGGETRQETNDELESSSEANVILTSEIGLDTVGSDARDLRKAMEEFYTCAVNNQPVLLTDP
jgi:hypothetical protein